MRVKVTKVTIALMKLKAFQIRAFLMKIMLARMASKNLGTILSRTLQMAMEIMGMEMVIIIILIMEKRVKKTVTVIAIVILMSLTPTNLQKAMDRVVESWDCLLD